MTKSKQTLNKTQKNKIKNLFKEKFSYNTRKGKIALVTVSVLAGMAVGTTITLVGTRETFQNIATYDGGNLTAQDLYKQIKTSTNAQTIVTNSLILEVYDYLYGDKISKADVEKAYKSDVSGASSLAQQLKNAGISEQEYKDTLKKQLAFNYGVKKQLAVSEGELKTAWANFHSDVKIQMMTFTSEETATNVKEQLDNGADFSTLAKSYSEDSYKGETKTYSNSDKYLPSSVMKEVYKLQNGEYTLQSYSPDDNTTYYFIVKMVEASDKGNDMSKYKNELTDSIKQNKLDSDTDAVEAIIRKDFKKANVKVTDKDFESTLSKYMEK